MSYVSFTVLLIKPRLNTKSLKRQKILLKRHLHQPDENQRCIYHLTLTSNGEGVWVGEGEGGLNREGGFNIDL